MAGTALAVQGFTDLERTVAREMARSDLYDFTRWMFLQRRGFPWQQNWHHQVLCDALMRVFRGECKRLIINIPPRYSKTEIAVINFIAWSLGRFPDAEFIHTSYSGRLAGSNAWQARELVLHPEYQRVFPGVGLRTDSTAKDEWRTTEGGIVYSAGSFGSITGYGAGKPREGFGGAIIVDDAHKADEATSDPLRTGVLDWFQNTLESRKNDPKNTPVVVIMQRLHEQDLAGWLLGGGNGEVWEHISLPALQDDGTALWPAKHTVEDLLRMKAAAPYVFSGQYAQRPSPLGGGLIKGEWFPRYTALPPIQFRKIFVDTAQKTAERNDYSVFGVYGLGFDGNLYVLDIIRGKWEAWALEATTVDVWEKHNAIPEAQVGVVRQMMVEDKSSGTGLIQDIKKKTAIPIVGIPRVKDKLTRLLDVQGYMQSGRVFLPAAAPWVSDFIAECESITADDTHAHDDQVDTLIDAITDMLGAAVNLSVWERLGG